MINDFKNPALHFSGGKDSLALLYLMRPWLENITVYHLDAGDQPEETKAVVEAVKEWVPIFVTVHTDSKAWRKANGIPTDLLPSSAEPLGIAYGMGQTPMASRFQCCSANLMLPMHLKMIEDKVDCVIRGTKSCDTGRVPFEGQSPWYNVILPLKDWTHQMVFEYLESQGAPKNSIYEQVKAASAPECLSCTAWWDDGKAAFLKKRYPGQYAEYQVGLQTIREALQKHLNELNGELE